MYSMSVALTFPFIPQAIVSGRSWCINRSDRRDLKRDLSTQRRSEQIHEKGGRAAMKTHKKTQKSRHRTRVTGKKVSTARKWGIDILSLLFIFFMGAMVHGCVCVSYHSMTGDYCCCWWCETATGWGWRALSCCLSAGLFLKNAKFVASSRTMRALWLGKILRAKF